MTQSLRISGSSCLHASLRDLLCSRPGMSEVPHAALTPDLTSRDGIARVTDGLRTFHPPQKMCTPI